MDWAPALYTRFLNERTRPAADLLMQVPLTAPAHVVDMGCGPGNSTELLVARYPNADVTGLDNSPAMLEAARASLPGVRFAHADAREWVPGSDVDLVFANAIYQWLPDPLPTLARVLAALRPGGVLAVQMPDNLDEPTHRLMQTVAADGPWAARLKGAARAPLPNVRAFYEALAPAAGHLDLWHSVYNHVLESPSAIVEWVRGTGLRPFIEPLDEGEKSLFLARYTDAIAAAYPAVHGKVLLRFPRLFIVAQKR